MNFSKEQKDYIIHALEHCEVLTGGRRSGKILELIKQQNKEIERLNNIINELEKALQLEVLKARENSEYNKGVVNAFNHTISLISQLKGSDKE